MVEAIDAYSYPRNSIAEPTVCCNLLSHLYRTSNSLLQHSGDDNYPGNSIK